MTSSLCPTPPPHPTPEAGHAHDTGPHGLGPSRRQVEARVRVARDEATAWAGSDTNAAAVGAHLDAFTTAWRSSGVRDGPLPADYLVLLREWGVPGILAPADVEGPMSEQWSRSVTVSLLRVLRRQGHMT